MTITQQDVGRAVVYRPRAGHEEHGVITGISHGGWVWVRYGTDTRSKATHWEQLSFTAVVS